MTGTAHHLQDIGRVLGRRDEALIEDVQALLRRDPANPHDPNAIEVYVYGALVGYLPKQAAAAWNRHIAAIEAAGETAGVDAHLWYRWPNGESQPGVFVNVRISEKPIRPRPVPSDPPVYANPTCPYCGAAPEKMPKQSRKCRSCGQTFYVQMGPDAVLYFLQDSDRAAMAKLWEEYDAAPGWDL